MDRVTPTQDQIVDRLKAITDDMFGFRQEVLVDALDYEHAKEYLKPEVTEAEWDEARTKDTKAAATGYLEFAIGKIRGHRGISAGRSVAKLYEYAWLLGRNDVVDAMDAADYPQYGAPQVKAFADGMGWPWPADDAELDRMALGLPCGDDCMDGCGR